MDALNHRTTSNANWTNKLSGPEEYLNGVKLPASRRLVRSMSATKGTRTQ